MKIYILRHEERGIETNMLTPLNSRGVENSEKLVDILKKENINLIFSSPFVRTLQTIYPYSSEMNIKINIDYSLSEYHSRRLISRENYGVNLPNNMLKIYNHNPNYKSIIGPKDIYYPETNFDCLSRVKSFLRYIIKNYKNTDKNILIVTHMHICLDILNIVNSKISKDSKIGTIDLLFYERGKLTKIFDDDWMYNEINYTNLIQSPTIQKYLYKFSLLCVISSFYYYVTK
jgi:2,3-bisphosphoglycerate-dependent phosphoglycerate mutase